MDFEAIPLYDKIVSGPVTSEEVRNVTNKHVSQKQKKFVGKIKSDANKKCTVSASIKDGFKKRK